LANPLGMASYATRGMKPTDSYVAFSVGTKAGELLSYVTTTPAGNAPSLRVSHGVAEFLNSSDPWPQSHQYVGMGDKIVSSIGTFYIKYRIGLNKWFVTNADGSVPDVPTIGTVTTIDKVFSTLQEALDGIPALIGGSTDLTILQLGVYIACYRSTDTQEVLDIEASWVQDENYRLKILSPSDTEIECNYNQRHDGTPGTGFVLKAATNSVPVINVKSAYTVIDGIEIQQNSGVSSTSLITLAASNCIVTNNLLHDSDNNAITINASCLYNICVSNIIYDVDYGIYDSGIYETRIFNNTIIATTRAVHFAAAPDHTILTNCILESALCVSHDVSDWHNLITSDATFGDGLTCIPNTTQVFKDRTAKDFRTWVNDVGWDMGADMSSYTALQITKDILGNVIDDTWSIGACHYVRKLIVALAPDVDHKTVPVSAPLSAACINGILTFTDSLSAPAPQIDPVLCSGFKVIVGANDVYLFDKISTSVWRVTDSSGNRPSDFSGAVTSIKAPYQYIDSAFNILGTDLVSIDTSLDIAYSTGMDGGLSGYYTSPVTCDSTRRIKIYTPNDTDVDCNVSRRHNGIFDISLPYVSASGFPGFWGVADHIIYDGLQVVSDYECIRILGENATISNSILNSTYLDGIRWGISSAAEIKIYNNLIYCEEDGIHIITPSIQKIIIYNNTITKCKQGMFIETDDSLKEDVCILLKNNICVNNSEFDYKLTYGFSSYVKSYCCWSSDLSINKFNGFFNKPLKSIEFRDPDNDDYRITFRDSTLSNESFDLSTDEHLSFNTGYRGNPRDDGHWDAGCDEWKAEDESSAIFSVGSHTGDLADVGSIITILNGVLTFENTPVDNIGVGDRIVYHISPPADIICYLGERGDQNTWKVIDDHGVVAADGTGEIVSAKRSFNTIPDALTGVAILIGTDLVSEGIGLNIKCYDDGVDYTDPASISGWTTSSLCRIVIDSPYQDRYTLNKQRHSNYWDSVTPLGFRIVVSESAAISIDQDHCTIEGLMIATDGYDGVLISNAHDDCIVRYNLIKDCSIGINSSNAGATNHQIDFNTIYDFITSGVSAPLTDGSNHCYNNTVVANPTPSSVTAYDFGATSMDCKNCIAQTGAGEVGFTGGVNYNCISSDSTAGVGNGNQNLVTLIFEDRSGKDFHITREDIWAIRLGYDTGAKLLDVDSETFEVPFSIGSDYFDIDHVDLFFSIGPESVNLMKLGSQISISQGIAYFTIEQNDSRVSIGDVVTYDTSKVCYLVEKITHFKWRVLTKYGEIPDDISSATLNSIRRWGNDLFTAQSDLQEWLGNSTSPFYSLTAAKYSINFVLHKNDYSGTLTITSMTGDQSNILRFYTPFDIYTECNSNQRHAGFDSGDEAIITGGVGCSIGSEYCTIEGIVFDSAGSNGISISAQLSGILIDGCIVHDADVGIDVNFNAYTIGSVINCIIYNCSGRGIIINGESLCANNTVINTGGINSDEYSYIINTIVQDSVTNPDFYSLTPKRNCVSSDSSAGSTDQNISNTSVTFKDKASNDFRLSIFDTLIRGTGYTTPYTFRVNVPFDYDSVGIKRGRLWDRGATEYQPSKRIIFSIGNRSTEKLTKTFENVIITIDELSVGSFSEPQTNNLLMIGDAVETEIGTFYLKRKLNESEWEIQNADGSSVQTIDSPIVTSIKSSYSELHEAVSAFEDIVGLDLVTEDTAVYLTCCKDMEDTTADILLSLLICDMDCFVRIFTPRDIYSECNASHRHSGTWSSWAATISPYGISIYASDYIEIEGLQSESDLNGIYVDQSINPFIVGNIVRNCSRYGIGINDQNYSNGIVANNLVYNCTNGIQVGSQSDSVDSQINVYNNTIVNCKRGLRHIKYFGDTAGSFIYSKNNLVQDSRYKDFVFDEKAQPFNISYNCLSSDESLSWQSGTHIITNQYINFIDRVKNKYQLKKFVDITAIDNAVDLSDDAFFTFDYDIGYRTRESLYWDIGAFEVVDISGFAELIIGPMYLLNSDGRTTDILPTAILYLYTGTGLTEDPAHTFTSISDLNTYLVSHSKNYNLIIYVQPGEIFSGEFNFQNHPIRTVLVQTDPNPTDPGVIVDAKKSASIEYTVNLIKDASHQEKVEFVNIEIFNDTDQNGEYLVSNTSNTSSMKFVNCIVQMNLESMVDTAVCDIEIINCQLVYNPSGSTIISLSNVLGGVRTIKNTSILADDPATTTFKNTSDSWYSDTDYIKNCLFFNLQVLPENCLWGDLATRVWASLIADPEFTDVTSLSDIYDVMTTEDAFKPLITSPLVDAGNNLYIVGFDLDIIESPRIFNNYIVDIGPYEIRVYKILFNSTNVVSLFQEKLISGTDRFLPTYGTVIYKDLHSQFIDADTKKEFAREAKVVIQISMPEVDYVVKSDKYDIEVKRLEARFDESSMSIVCYKDSDFIGDVFGSLFDDDRYVFYFDEANHVLIIYLNQVYDKCLSGNANVVRNVKFGGPTILSR